MDNLNLDFGNIDNLNSIGEEMIEVNVPAADPVGATQSTEANELPNGGTEAPAGNETANEPPANDDAGLIEISDTVVDENSNEGSPQAESTQPPAQNADSPSDSIVNTTTAFAKALTEQGVLPALPDDFDGKPESLLQLIGNRVEADINSYKESLPAEIKQLVNNYEEGVPLDQLIQARSQTMRYKSITDDQLAENVDLQKSMVAQDLKLRGFSDEKIQQRIQLFEDQDILKQEATDAKVTLTSAQERREAQLVEQAKLAKEKEVENSKARLNTFKSKIDETSEIVPGIELTDVSKAKLYESMTKVVSTDENGRPMNAVMATRQKDPVQFEMTLHYLHNLGVFNGDFSQLTESQQTSALQELKQQLSGNTGTISSGKGVTPKQDNGILSSLKMFGSE